MCARREGAVGVHVTVMAESGSTWSHDDGFESMMVACPVAVTTEGQLHLGGSGCS